MRIWLHAVIVLCVDGGQVYLCGGGGVNPAGYHLSSVSPVNDGCHTGTLAFVVLSGGLYGSHKAYAGQSDVSAGATARSIRR